ncbi:hypothetical protein Tco_1200976 [Tanacetum coccineum]
MTTALSIENGSSIEGRVLFKFNVWVPIGKCNRVLERQKKLRNQIFRALTASADVPSSVTETTDTTSTLQPPRPPLQTYQVSSEIFVIRMVRLGTRSYDPARTGGIYPALGMIKRSKCENKGIVPTEMELVLEYTQQGASHEVSDHLKMEMEMEIPSVKASANSDIIFFFTSAQDGNRLLDDERLSLADDLKKAHDHNNQNKSK